MPSSKGRPSHSAKRALVTGGAGFIGSNLVDRLLRDGWSILVVDDLSTGRLDWVSPTARFEQLDIVSQDLDRPFRRWKPHVVFHLAAQTSVPKSLAEPLGDLSVNVVGTHRVASAARHSGAARIVFVSSGGAVYGETVRPATEEVRPAPISYYGAHKLAAEAHIALAGLPFAIARPSNIYGPRQAASLEGAVVAAFLVQARSGVLRIHGDGNQVRDFVHVIDAVEGLRHLAETTTSSGIWNVSSGETLTIRALGDLIEDAVGRPLERDYSPPRDGDVRRSEISAVRLRRLGWRPTMTMAQAIQELIPQVPTV